MPRRGTERDQLTGEVIEVERWSSAELVPSLARASNEFARVPRSHWVAMPGYVRLWLALHMATSAWPEDEAGGWYRFSAGLADRAELRARSSRNRAVEKLERSGAIEVRRRPGRSSLLRLTPPEKESPQ